MDRNKKFFLLSKDNLNGLNGSAKFIKVLSGDKTFWKSKKIDVMVFSNSGTFSCAESYRKTVKFKIKQYIKWFLDCSIWGKRLKLRHTVFVLGGNVIRNVKEKMEFESWILLNDFSVAYVFCHLYKNQYKTIFMMHNNGNLFSMLDSTLKTDGKTKKFLQRIEGTIFCNVTKIVFVSENSKNYFCEKMPEYAEKAMVIYNGISAGKVLDKERNNAVLHLITVGTVCKRKNQRMIIEVLSEINDSSIKLTVVGAGEELNNCRKYVKEHGLDKQVKFVGAVNNVKPYLNEANLFIMTSTDEGLPISAQEAMREGLPLILTDVGGCEELIDGNGLLITPDHGEVKKAIEYINNNKHLLSEWGQRSRTIFNSKFTDKQMRNMYYRLISS